MSKSGLSPIEAEVQNKLDRHFSSPFFIVAVSGGMDSMSLLHAFKELDVSALVSHINYQKRGAAADKDALLVGQKAREWGFNCHTATADPADAEGQNFQQWARAFRYDLFRQLAKEHNANGIALAHHEDDQVETILQKIFRGAGLVSWSGMTAWNGELFRPLLDVSRAQIEEYVKQNDIPYRTDESNLKSNFARNLLRNEWLDKLANFFPGWKSNVLNISDQANNYGQAVSWIADQVSDERGIKREAFHSLPPGVQKTLLLFLMKKQKPGLEISKDSLMRVEDLPELQTGKRITFSAGLSVLRDRNYYVISGESDTEFKPATLEQGQLRASSRQIGEITLEIGPYQNPHFGEALYLDAEAFSWPITLRRWEEGDRIRPLGMEGHQLVSDHLTNRKVSAATKNKALVIESFEETICAIIFPPIQNQSSPGTISDQMRCTPDTENCLKITNNN